MGRFIYSNTLDKQFFHSLEPARCERDNETPCPPPLPPKHLPLPHLAYQRPADDPIPLQHQVTRSLGAMLLEQRLHLARVKELSLGQRCAAVLVASVHVGAVHQETCAKRTWAASTLSAYAAAKQDVVSWHSVRACTSAPSAKSTLTASTRFSGFTGPCCERARRRRAPRAPWLRRSGCSVRHSGAGSTGPSRRCGSRESCQP